jgi:hypothetical protein
VSTSTTSTFSSHLHNHHLDPHFPPPPFTNLQLLTSSTFSLAFPTPDQLPFPVIKMEFSVIPNTSAPPHTASFPLSSITPSPQRKRNTTITLVSPKKRNLSLHPHSDPDLALGITLSGAGPSEHASDRLPLVEAHDLSPPPMKPSPNKSLSASRHLVFDTFSLKSSDGTMHHPTTAESDLIIALFPTTFSISFLPPVVIIPCVNLPPKPWPVTVAGVPAWFTSDEGTYPVPLGMVGLKGKALEDHALPLWKTPTTSEFSKVIESLNNDFGVETLSVLWAGTRFLIVKLCQVQSWDYLQHANIRISITPKR